MNIPHIPVLLNEVIEVFSDMKDGYFIDCTLGFGGHSEAILERHPDIKLIAIDQDREAMNFAKKRLEKYINRIIFINKRASEALKEIEKNEYKISGILADIGVSSYQLDEDKRGFNFNGDTLDMRMNQTQEFSAYDVVNFYSLDELERIFRDYGEERYFKKIASEIIKKRKEEKFKSSKQLADFIDKLVPRGKIHPATKIFQAIRIEVNNELNELENILKESQRIANNGTILAIISFHSLEDRIVKNRFKDLSKKCICPSDNFRCECGGDNDKGKVLTKRPLSASKEEIKANPRSRSAKIRAFKFR
jgi:16S rRNA (cytosine1402-N4)-methyltransferase